MKQILVLIFTILCTPSAFASITCEGTGKTGAFSIGLFREMPGPKGHELV